MLILPSHRNMETVPVQSCVWLRFLEKKIETTNPNVHTLYSSTPPQKHKNTTTKTQKHHHKKQPRHRKNTTTKSQKHHHKKQPRHRKNTTTKSQKHHHKNTTTPPQKHNHKNTTTPPQKHNHKNTHITTETQPHHQHFVRDFLHFSLLWKVTIDDFLRVFLTKPFLQFCDASATFQTHRKMPCEDFGHYAMFGQRWHDESSKQPLSHVTKCCACHEIVKRTSTKGCACHDKTTR